MLLHTVYTVVTPANKALGVKLPFALSLDADTKASLVEQEGGIQLLIDRKIDHTRFEVLTDSSYYKELPDEPHQPIPNLRLVNDVGPERIISPDLISALTFLTYTTIS